MAPPDGEAIGISETACRAALADSRRRLSLHDHYTLKEEPQPQVLLTFGFSNLKPAPSRVST